MNTQIEEIKDKLDVLNLIHEYVPSLKPKGRNYFGLCPFHNEKSPSFSVNPELKIFKCFGCGEGGDVITFLEKIEGLEFREALELAAQRAGVELKDYSSAQDSEYKKKKERALESHKLAAQYYHYLLTQHKSGQKCLDYALRERRLNTAMLERFQLGYAPNGYHNLENYLTKKGFTRAELVEYGLLATKDGRAYDKFRNRLLHPIHNVRGEVVGFSGRVIIKDTNAPKYLNSPETVIYHKQELLYGLYQAKEALRRTKKAIVVEGNLDVVSSVKVNVESIVCPLGTALTTAQLKLLKRYADEVYFAFDTDEAGRKALLRSFELAEALNINTKVIDLKQYKDVDELVNKAPEQWQQFVEDAHEVPEYILEIFKKDFNMASAQEKSAYLNLVLPYVAKITEKVKIDHYLQRLELVTSTKYEILADKLNEIKANIKAEKVLERAIPNNSGAKVSSASEVGDKKIEAEVELPASRQNSVKEKYPARLISLVNYAYYWKEFIPELDELKKVYSGNILPVEARLLDMSLAMSPDEVVLLGQDYQQLKDDFVEMISMDMKVDMRAESPKDELAGMLKNYVLERLRSYLKILKNSPDDSVEKVVQRISAYTKKIAELS